MQVIGFFVFFFGTIIMQKLSSKRSPHKRDICLLGKHYIQFDYQLHHYTWESNWEAALMQQEINFHFGTPDKKKLYTPFDTRL